MLAFGTVIGSPEKFERFAAPGLRRVREPSSVVLEVTEATSMCSALNEVLDACAHLEDLEALVLLHEDTELRDPHFCRRVTERLAADPALAVLGAVGAQQVRSLAWWEGRGVGRVHETRGLVDFAAGHHPADAVDGLLLVLSPWAVRHLRFDEATFPAWHGYDVDLCFQARAAGRHVAVDDLPLVHHTKGGFGDEAAWRAADAAFRAKWRLPAAAQHGGDGQALQRERPQATAGQR